MYYYRDLHRSLVVMPCYLARQTGIAKTVRSLESLFEITPRSRVSDRINLVQKITGLNHGARFQGGLSQQSRYSLVP